VANITFFPKTGCLKAQKGTITLSRDRKSGQQPGCGAPRDITRERGGAGLGISTDCRKRLRPLPGPTLTLVSPREPGRWNREAAEMIRTRQVPSERVGGG